MKPTAPTLYYDIETAAGIGLWFGKPYEASIAKTIQHEYVFGFAYKWSDQKTIRSCYIWDFPQYHKPLQLPKREDLTLESFLLALKARNDGRNVLKKWSELVGQAGMIVGHNSDQFDYRQMHGRLVEYELPPIAWPQTFDTKKAAKQIGYYPSNKLDDLSERFGYGNKQKHEGIELWWRCMNGDEKAQREMVRYNKRDVDLTEKLYLRVRPYAKTHPNMANLIGRPDACPRCGAEGQMIAAGFKYTTTGRYRYYQCKACGKKSKSRFAERDGKPNYV